jgi:F-type H+-transporting ATPase subunit b
MEINATLIGQLITFAILVGFTMKYVWPPIIKAINEREKKIAVGLELTERSKRELEMAEHKALNIIREAKQEALRVVEHAHKRSAQLVEESKQIAREEGQHILRQAQEEIVREANQTKEVLRKQLAVLAVAGAEKIIKQHIDLASQTALLNEFMAEI